MRSRPLHKYVEHCAVGVSEFPIKKLGESQIVSYICSITGQWGRANALPRQLGSGTDGDFLIGLPLIRARFIRTCFFLLITSLCKHIPGLTVYYRSTTGGQNARHCHSFRGRFKFHRKGATNSFKYAMQKIPDSYYS